MPMSIQYAGFQVQPHGRDYSYYVLDPPAASRHFILTISHQAFAERQYPVSGRRRPLLPDIAASAPGGNWGAAPVAPLYRF